MSLRSQVIYKWVLVLVGMKRKILIDRFIERFILLVTLYVSFAEHF